MKVFPLESFAVDGIMRPFACQIDNMHLLTILKLDSIVFFGKAKLICSLLSSPASLQTLQLLPQVSLCIVADFLTHTNS